MRDFRKYIFVISIYYLCTLNLYSQSGTVLRSLELKSKILNQCMKFSVYLPAGYESSREYFPTLFLLHGFGGNENSWLDRCQLVHIIDSLVSNQQLTSMVIIMPEAKNSFYLNNYNGSFLFEDYFVKELIPHVDSVFRIKPSSVNKAIAGLSMGGFGAVLTIIKHPDIFGTAMALSGSFRTEGIYKNLPQKTYNQLYSNVFGPELNSSQRLTNHWKANNPYDLMDSINIARLRQKNLYLDCGQQDQLIEANEAFHRMLIDKNIPHEYHIRQGSHNWEYWEKGFIWSLLYLDHKINTYSHD